MDYGVTVTGFVKKPLEVCRAELEAAIKEQFGDESDVSAASPFGQLIGIFAEREADLWEGMELVYLSQYPDTAAGVPLVDVCSITGTVPEAPTKSTVTVTVTGTNGSVGAAGRVFQVVNSGARFVTTEAATLASLTAWVALTPYVVGDRRSNSSKSYICITAGTSAASGGPTTTVADITDGTAHWRYLGAGTAAADVACESEDTGPKVANAFTLTSIITAVAGWTSATNLLDAELGTDLETDTALRARREDELRRAGAAATEAVREDILAIDGVTACRVFENDTDADDADGLPPHSIEVVTLDDYATDTVNAIRAAIFASKAGGIEAWGSDAGTVIDSEGNTHIIDFTHATEKWVWLTVAVTKDATTSLTNAEIQTAVKAAIVAWADPEYHMGDDVITAKLDFPIWRDAAAGVVDVTVTSGVTASGAGAPAYTSANKAIAAREIARFDTSRITVNVT